MAETTNIAYMGTGTSSRIVPVTLTAPLPVAFAPLSSAANVAAATQPSAGIITGPGEWSLSHAPAHNNVASASKAAGTGTQRHVCTGLSVIVSAGVSAPAATVVTAVLRDGATGAGTILKTWTFVVPAAAGVSQGVSRNGMHVFGSAATAMTLETSNTASNILASVEFEGYTTE